LGYTEASNGWRKELGTKNPLTILLNCEGIFQSFYAKVALYMDELPSVKPLSLQRRRYLSFFLLGLFVLGLPFLYLYATGYRFSLDANGTFISTGGLYVAAKRTGAEIYIDNQLVRETRTFRTAFYAQGLEPGTHRVHVQRDGYHTWVKELPVYAHVVTEAQAFNIALVPQLRFVSPWKNSVGDTVLFASSTLAASSTNTVVVQKSKDTAKLISDTEYETLLELFSGEAQKTPTTASLPGRVGDLLGGSATTTATTTKESNSVRLYQQGDDVAVSWTSSRESMPYYYCAEEFDLLGDVASEVPTASPVTKKAALALAADVTTEMIGPVQSVSQDALCTPEIILDRRGETVRDFDFYPGSTDLALLTLDSGVYVEEFDGRAWHNMQPIVLGKGFHARVQNGQIYLYDGKLVYQVIVE